MKRIAVLLIAGGILAGRHAVSRCSVGAHFAFETPRDVHEAPSRYRNDPKAARSSDAKSSGSSHAAKCPPRSTALK